MISLRPHKPLTLGTVEITKRERQLVNEVLDSGKLSPGQKAQHFERLVAARHGLPHATYCNSGQSALHLALEALKLHQPRLKRVLVPAVTYISSLHAVWNAGLQVVLCDVDPTTALLDLSTHRGGAYDAVMPVHLFGKACVLPEQPVPVVEDGCEALGAPGSGYGEFLCLSFYVAHTITTGVGGMVLTPVAQLDEDVKRLCNHGRVRGSDLYAGLRVDRLDASVRFRFNAVGFSYKLGDLNAALGIAQMERLDAILARRRTIGLRLIGALQDIPALQLPNPDGHTFMMFPLVCREPALKAPLVAHLNEAGIETRDLMPVTTQPIVHQILGDIEAKYPVAQQLNAQGFYVGVHHQLTDADVDYLVETLHAFPY